MKKKEFNQLKEMNLEGLKPLLEKTRLEAAKVKMEINRGKQKNVHAYLIKRKEITKIMTLINQKEALSPELTGEKKVS